MKVLVGISGGIAAYKGAEIVRAFKKRGDEVRVVMTAGAQEFITPLTLQVLSENAVGTDLFDPTFEHQIGHIDLARWPDVILVAPATANLIARAAQGMATDLLTTVLTATTAPVVFAPAMNTQMLLHPRVQANIHTLANDGHFIVDPDSGELACKEVGPGRLPDPEDLLRAVDYHLGQGDFGSLEGKKILVSAGPTREHLDPARFLSNPSTGKMGYAIAKRAAVLGADVTLVSGPTDLAPPNGLHQINVITAEEMAGEVLAIADSQDIVVMAAAVADWRPKESLEKKRSKTEGDLTLEFERTTDILKTLGEKKNGAGPLLVGFAAESHDVVERAREKRTKKNADVIVANEIGGIRNAFGANDNHVWVIGENFEKELVRADKHRIARQLWQVLIEKTNVQA